MQDSLDAILKACWRSVEDAQYATLRTCWSSLENALDAMTQTCREKKSRAQTRQIDGHKRGPIQNFKTLQMLSQMNCGMYCSLKCPSTFLSPSSAVTSFAKILPPQSHQLQNCFNLGEHTLCHKQAASFPNTDTPSPSLAVHSQWWQVWLWESQNQYDTAWGWKCWAVLGHSKILRTCLPCYETMSVIYFCGNCTPDRSLICLMEPWLLGKSKQQEISKSTSKSTSKSSSHQHQHHHHHNHHHNRAS